MASTTIASLQRSPWSRITPTGYQPIDSDDVVGNAPVNDEGEEAGIGSRQNQLAPAVRISVGRFYPEWAKARLRSLRRRQRHEPG